MVTVYVVICLAVTSAIGVGLRFRKKRSQLASKPSFNAVPVMSAPSEQVMSPLMSPVGVSEGMDLPAPSAPSCMTMADNPPKVNPWLR